MKRKLNVFMMVFALIFSLHSGAYAEEAPQAEIKLEENLSQKAPAKEGEKEEDQTRKETEKPDEDSEIDQAGKEEMELSDEKVSDPISNQQGEETEPSEGEPKPGKNQPAGGEEQPKTDEGQPAEDGKKNPTPEDPKKPSKKAVDPSSNEEMKALDEKINKTKDPKERAKLEKEYNEKYAKLLAGTNKLDDSVLDRIKDKDKINKYHELKAEYDAILEKLKKENPNSKENQALREKLDDLNKKIAESGIPRLLDEDEKKAQDDLNNSVDVPRLKEGATKDAKEKLDAYNKAKENLADALNADKDRETSQEKLEELVKAFNDAQKALKDGIENGSIDPAYTKGDPTVRVFPLDGGKLGDELKKKEGQEDETYYIPDNTNLDLLFHINKDDEPKEFTFTLKALAEEGLQIPDGKASNLAFLNGDPVELTKNEDGSYSFTVNSEKTFGIAQLRFNMPGFRAALHKGFDLEINVNGKTQIKKFRITKKGYEDKVGIEGQGSTTDKEPSNIPEIDAGKTENAIVDPDTDKVFDFFTYLKKSNTYIDDVLVNSTNGESIPLSSVDITITVPKNQEGKFAEMIHKSGLKYHKLKDGKYQLKLDTKVFGGNLEKDKDGKYYLIDEKGNKKKEVELSKETITNAILENAGKKVYVDEKGKAYEITKTEYLEGKKFKLEGKKLSEKIDGKYQEIGTFDDKNKIEKDGMVYELKANKITYYKKANAFDGKAVNEGQGEDKKANPSLSVTEKGKQVEIIVDGQDGKSYGGTILEDAIYDKAGKYFNEKDYIGENGDIAINSDGTKADITFNKEDIVEDEKSGIKTVKVGDKTYRVVTNPVFKGGYLIDGLTYHHGLSLVDKYGRKMDVEVAKNGDKYTFTRKVMKDGKEEKDEVSSGTDTERKRTVNVVEDKDDEIIVDSTNKIVDNSDDKYEIVRDKYYYDGKIFKKFEPKTDILESRSKETYDGGKELPKVDKTYQGSTNLGDYYNINGKIYVQKSQGTGEDAPKYYVNADPNSKADILSEGKIAKIVQTLGEGKDAKEVVTDETSIFDAVKNAVFGLRFPGFLAGKNIVYKVHADVKASYKNADGKEKSIFKDGHKEANRYFTLKNEKSTSHGFFKNYPEELKKHLDYNFFNIFYRSMDDRERDKLVIEILKNKKNLKQENKEDKAKLDFLAKLQGELEKLNENAKFAVVQDKNGNDKLIIQNKEGEELDRTLVWELGFKQSNTLFPENTDTEIIIEDYNLDNRLIYDEIIVNDKKETWEKAKKEYEEAVKALEKDPENKELQKAVEEKKFEGSSKYFFIDQIKDIRFGVSPSFKEGRFVPLGDEFTLTSDQILNELGNGDSATITKNDIKYQITRDKTKGQIRIKVINAFYKKADKESKAKFTSPVQEAYGKKIDQLKKDIKNLDASSEENLKKSFGTIIDNFVDGDDQAKKDLEARFDKMLAERDKKKELSEIKDILVAELNKLPLTYLDGEKKEYLNNDMRFNALRIALKSGIQLGGPLSPEPMKKLDITTVIVPELDIPYTDEYGNLMTNKNMYVKDEIKKILEKGIGEGKEKKTYTKKDLTDEEKYREILTEAYNRVNKNYKGKIKKLVEIKDENKVGREKYTVRKGSDFDYSDLALVKDKNKKAINPWYIGKESVKDKFDKAGITDGKALQKYKDKPIDLAAYYMSHEGYDRNKYGNQANYKIDKANQNEGLFGKEDSFKSNPYYPPIGYVIDKPNEGKSNSDTDNAAGKKFGEKDKTSNEFELSYTPDSDSTTGENPGVEKKVQGNSSVDISGEKEKSVDFTIDVTVDKMTKSQKKLADALKDDQDKKENKEDEEALDYNERGFYEYKNSLIADILPDIFTLKGGKDGTKLELEADREGLMANGANAGFANKEAFDKWYKDIEYAYTDDLETYAQGLTGGRKELVDKLIKEARNSGKVKEGEKIRAILAFLPNFEAPHGSRNQFKFKLTKVFVDKKKFKDFNDGFLGTNYTNHAAFGDKAKFYHGHTNVNIHEGPDKKVNKYLQVLDKDGNVLDKDKADGWFKGNAKLKFGDKFNYRIEQTRKSGIMEIPGEANTKSEISIEDILAGVKEKGLRPVLRDFVTVGPTGFVVEYKIDGKVYTKEEIIAQKLKLSDVTGLILKANVPDGTTFHFDIPMEIPTFDAEIEDGEIKYVGKNGEKKVIGEAKDFFDLDKLKDEKEDLVAENAVKDSNTVKVYLDKNRFLRVFKEFYDQKGEKITENRPQVEFEIYQIELDKDGKPILDEKGNPKKVLMKDKDGNPLTLVVNQENGFTDIANNLPFYKKTVEVDDKGNVIEKIVRFDYQIKEVDAKGYDVEIHIVEDKDGLGFVMQAKNTKKPEEPENPNEPPEDPENPDEPGKPNEPDEPENPDEPKDKEKEKPDEPSDKDKDRPGVPEGPDSPDNPNKPGYPGRPRLPKTGAVTDFMSLYLSGLILLLAIIARKKVRE